MPDTSRLVCRLAKLPQIAGRLLVDASFVESNRDGKGLRYGCLARNAREGEDDESRGENGQSASFNFWMLTKMTI